MRIGFVGLGHMGAPMAGHLIKAGHSVRGYDLRPDQAEKAVGAERSVSSPLDLLDESDVILTMLPSGPALQELLLGESGLEQHWRKDLILLDMSTTAPTLARKLADRIHARGGGYLEAPVSGGTAGARSGTLTIIAAGNEELFRRLSTVFEPLGDKVYFVGSPGAGQTLKLANNLLLAVNVAAVAEAWGLVRGSGVDPRTAFEVLTSCSGDSRALRTRVPEPELVPGYPPSDEYRPGFTLELMLKDASLAEELASQLGVATPSLEAARARYERALADGFAGADISIVGRGQGADFG